MDTLFALLFLFTPFVGLYFVLMKQQFNAVFHTQWSRKKIFLAFLTLLIGSFIGFGVTSDTTQSTENESEVKRLTVQDSQAEIIAPVDELEDTAEEVESAAVAAEEQVIVETSTPTPSPLVFPSPTPRIIQTPTPTPKQVNTPMPTSTITPAYGCNCSKTCSNMISCNEAYFQLNSCGCRVRDRDNDGVPCEDICPGG